MVQVNLRIARVTYRITPSGEKSIHGEYSKQYGLNTSCCLAWHGLICQLRYIGCNLYWDLLYVLAVQGAEVRDLFNVLSTQ